MCSLPRHPQVIAELLAKEYPEAACELDYRTPWELLVATVLSAQCTDARVNRVTPELFSTWPGPGELAAAPQEAVESIIRSTGMFRRKAASLRALAERIETDHDGRVPRTLNELTALPGVGRKTAKVVLGEAFGIAAGVTVDTHVRRLAQRLGLTEQNDPERVAGDLEAVIAREQWIDFSKRLILHGRRVCGARSPRCESCVLDEACPKVGVLRGKPRAGTDGS
jgi:endonuclease-3